jgi:hypothetical protein
MMASLPRVDCSASSIDLEGEMARCEELRELLDTEQ